MTHFLSRFAARCEAVPEQVQFTLLSGTRVQPVTNAALLDGARRFAGLFLASGARPGDVVLIALTTSAELYEAFLGALWLGCIPSLMPFPTSKQDPVAFWNSHDTLFRHLGGGVIVTFAENLDAIRRNTTPGLMRPVTAADATGRYDGALHPWAMDEPCCLQHSSGTTGLKKGVVLTLDMIERQTTAYVGTVGIAPDDTFATWLPLYHDMGFITNLILPLGTGNHVVAMSPFDWLADPLSLFDAIDEFDARYTWLPNFALNHLSRSMDPARRRDLSRMKAFVNCSEPCKPETFRRFEATFADWGVRPEQMHVCYGMAEAVFAVTHTRPGRPPGDVAVRELPLRDESGLASGHRSLHRICSVGSVIPGMEIRIDGSDIGEILVRGGCLFQGYFRQNVPELLSEGWYRTGDVGFLWNDELYVLGRNRDLIVSLGRNVFAHDIEALVNDVTGVKPGRCVAFGMFDPEVGSEEVVVVAELDGGQAGDAVRKAVRATLQDTLALVPRRILLVQPGWLVKSTSGKISRGANADKYRGMLECQDTP